MSEKYRVLVVDDEPNIRRILQVALEKAGYLPYVAEDALGALKVLDEVPIQCVLSDVTMPGMTGYDLLREVGMRFPNVPFIIMTAYGTIPQAIQAIRDGAFEFVTKPFDLDHLKKVIANAVEGEQGTQPVRKSGSKSNSNEKPFIAASEPMQEILATVQQVAESRATVLITGESGTGKEVIARALHSFSARSKKPFIAVNCAALPETLLESELFGYEKGAFTGANTAKAGRFEAASEGTLFLDEIGEIPLATQVKLLRVLQEREIERLGSNKPTKVDVRLVTATNRDLALAVDDGTFRLDLMYRLQVVEVQLPPLRERKEDILPLVDHFLAKFCKENDREKMTVDEAAQQALLAYRWPGNVRELENTVERAVVLSAPTLDAIGIRQLPPSMLKAA